MVLKYTGLSGGWFMNEGMLLIVPTNWRTTEFGNVTADAWSEILDALREKGITLGSRRSWNHVFSEFHLSDGTSWLTNWEKA